MALVIKRQLTGDFRNGQPGIYQQPLCLIDFLPLDIYTAKARHFQVVGDKLMPSINSIDGLGEKAADSIEEAAKDGKFLSKEDFRNRTKVSKTICDLMEELGILKGLPESNQLSLFDF